MLVVGGPGSGKTTIALLRAGRACAELAAGQEVLFLSFSRAAVRQIISRATDILSADQRKAVRVQTYHLFCLLFLRSHGALLSRRRPQFVVPAEERLLKSRFDGDWDKESVRLAREESVFCFDHLAYGVADLLERSIALRTLYSDKYPIVIVDEFQDTDDDQWRVVRALSQDSEVACLADPDQRIFDYRPNVDPRRLTQLRDELHPVEFDLGTENHRSPATGILLFADSVLRNEGPLPDVNDVRTATYRGKNFDATVHAHVCWTLSRLSSKGVANPSLAVLCRSNSLVSSLSGALVTEHKYRGKTLPPVAHDVVWDADLSASAGEIIGSVLEWRPVGTPEATAHTFQLIGRYFLLKNAEKPSKSAATKARQFGDAAAAVRDERQPRIKAAKLLVAASAELVPWTGNPVSDWLAAQRILVTAKDLNELVTASKMIRLFRATDVLASELAACWLAAGSYEGAAALIRRTLDRQRLMASEREATGCQIMTMHKSKGKEFDAVVLVEGQYGSPFFSTFSDKPPFERSRRLLRVAITRARSYVTLIRPPGAPSLVD